MNHHDPKTGRGEDAGSHETDAAAAVDVTISRIVDGESSEHDRDRFRRLAADTPELWRELGEQRMHHDALSDRVAAEVAPALRVELAHDTVVADRGGSLRWLATFSGWAALVALALVWSVRSVRTESAERAGDSTPVQLTADQHFDEYLTAPNVLGELEPVVLEVEELADGRIAIRYLRRVEEFVFVEADELDDQPLDASLDRRAGDGL